MSSATTNEASCMACKKPQSQLANSLKSCAKCNTQKYCSRECQKADWKTHKKACGKSNAGANSNANANTNANTSNTNSSGPRVRTIPASENPFAAISENRFFDGKPEAEAFAQIIDSYRLRVEDEYKFMGETRGIYNQERPRADFNRYLDKAERKGVLPTWWNTEKRRACEEYGFDDSNWSDLKCAVEKSDIIEHYGNGMMPMHLRMVAEEVEGSNVMGQPAGAGLRSFASVSAQGATMANFDMSSMFRR